MTNKQFDPFDPIAQAYRRTWQRFRNILIVFSVIILMALLFGVPSIQWNYRAYKTDGIPTAMDKLAAEYWNPIMGLKTFEAGDLAPGCPLIAFVPIRKCFED